jgi:5-methyltetrahydropteroyltriglutamate--homocysteine methyltransferase
MACETEAQLVKTHILGYPRIGARRELKSALESYWRGGAEANLTATARALRAAHHEKQAATLAFITAGDFSLYDSMLDHAALFGSLPRRFGFDARRLTLGQYFALARGTADQPALEMTKWFDTNYHYIVPELSGDTTFDGGPDWYFESIREALEGGHAVKPVLIGPLTFLRLSKTAEARDRLHLMPMLARAYGATLERLRALGIEWVQIDEPAFCLDLDPAWLEAGARAYAVLAAEAPRLLLATYFGSAAQYRERIVRLPVHGIHVDGVRAPEELPAWRACLPSHWIFSAGVIDGRNVWRADLRRALETLRPLHDALGERLWIAPSCSLLHVPVALAQEDGLDPEILPWLAFADEKLDELKALATGLERGEAAIRNALEASTRARHDRAASARVVNEAVRSRMSSLDATMFERASAFPERNAQQRSRLQLPVLPTTTIGSFPQTPAVRRTRAAFRRGEVGHLEYLEAMRAEVRDVIARQTALGLDVLVHGEPERSDMVEFFAGQLWGFAVTSNGWVQSYGSRCVKPPVIYGDVCRSEPMTVDTARYAQSLTEKPVKGMLTGPVTLLQWSFARDDLPRPDIAFQIALAIRDEVADLQSAGIAVIQIDEPALREGLPLAKAQQQTYLDWAVRAFRLAASIAADETQVHSHMCYSDFNDILPAIAALDADVVTIEASRSNMALLDAFGDFRYPNDIGPGVYDIHSPRVPKTADMATLIERAARVVPPERLWVNPDCGLKTRDWPETETALAHMVEAARCLRARL